MPNPFRGHVESTCPPGTARHGTARHFGKSARHGTPKTGTAHLGTGWHGTVTARHGLGTARHGQGTARDALAITRITLARHDMARSTPDIYIYTIMGPGPQAPTPWYGLISGGGGALLFLAFPCLFDALPRLSMT